MPDREKIKSDVQALVDELVNKDLQIYKLRCECEVVQKKYSRIKQALPNKQEREALRELKDEISANNGWEDSEDIRAVLERLIAAGDWSDEL